MMRPRYVLGGLIAVTLAMAGMGGIPVAAAPSAKELTTARPPVATAPAGTLVIAGGGALPPDVFKAFVEAAGGRGARIAVLPVASGVPDESIEALRKPLTELGAVLVPIRLTDRASAADAGRLAVLASCTGFWFTGGDQNRIGDLVVGTPLHETLWAKYRAGGVIGGTSAGAAAMSQIMLTGDGDLGETAPGTFKTREGLGFLTGCIVDQHFLRRSRENRLLSLIQDHPDLFGVGIDEETAFVVHHGQGSVVGRRKVLVFDPRMAKASAGTVWDLRLHLMGVGQTLDLTSRRPQ
ncbi:MAG: cyanophycinase [Candidatus Sericytochromatia bacterium]|nr:cyanophycinase [Candidatus Sericytochromatia bacterium]